MARDYLRVYEALIAQRPAQPVREPLIAGRLNGMNEDHLRADWPDQEPRPAPESYHIEATKSLVERTLRTLKHDDLFGVFDKQGEFRRRRARPRRPLLPGHALPFRSRRCGSAASSRCSSARCVLDDNGAMIVDLANADLHDADGRIWLQRDSRLSRPAQIPARQHLLRAHPAAALRPGRAADPARDRVRRRFRRPVRGARRAPRRRAARCAPSGSTTAASASLFGPRRCRAPHDRCTSIRRPPR